MTHRLLAILLVFGCSSPAFAGAGASCKKNNDCGTVNYCEQKFPGQSPDCIQGYCLCSTHSSSSSVNKETTNDNAKDNKTEGNKKQKAKPGNPVLIKNRGKNTTR